MQIQLVRSMVIMVLFSYHLQANVIPKIDQYSIRLENRSEQVYIDYYVKDPDNKFLETTLQVSYDGGLTFENVARNTIKGDIGYPIRRNKKCKLSWSYKGKEINWFKCMFRLIVDDREQVKVDELLSKIDTASIKAYINQVHGERHQYSEKGRAHHAQVKGFISDVFSQFDMSLDTTKNSIPARDLKANWERYDLNYELDSRDSEILRPGNVIGTKTGLSGETKYLVTAHYDTDIGSPGYDDNGSGVAAMLEIARVLSSYEFTQSLEFIAFDQEEDGLIGSFGYVFYPTKPALAKVEGVLNLDMIGYRSFEKESQYVPNGFDQLFPEVIAAIEKNENRGDFTLIIYNEASSFLDSAFTKNAQQYAADLNVHSISAELSPGEYIDDLRQGDHASFWYKGLPAIHIGEGGPTRNPWVHSARDSKEYLDLDFNFMSSIIKIVIASLIDLAEIRHSSSILIHPTSN